MKNTSLIFLVGFSGSGKSTVGPLLAKRRRVRFVDIDDMIERTSGMSIAEMFRTQGEPAFREAERAVLRDSIALCGGEAVIALGGGAFVGRENRRLIGESGVSVYLSCAERELYRRLSGKDDRPLLNVRPKTGETLRQARLRRIAGLLARRRRYYEMSEVIVSTTNRTAHEVVYEIERKIERFGEHD